MTISDKLLAGERVTIDVEGKKFDLTYGPADSPRLTTHLSGNVSCTAVISADVLRQHITEQERRYGWREAVADGPAPRALKLVEEEVPEAVEEAAPATAAPDMKTVDITPAPVKESFFKRKTSTKKGKK